jgi:hypothetical protein
MRAFVYASYVKAFLFFKSTLQTFWAHRLVLLKWLLHFSLLAYGELSSLLDTNDNPSTYDCKDFKGILKMAYNEK